MSKPKKLTPKQQKVLRDLFESDLDEQGVLARHKVTQNVYQRWLTENRFLEELNKMIAGAYRQSELIIARYSPLAAAKLVELTESGNQETARKACLDIISLPKSVRDGISENGEPVEEQGWPKLNDETAGKILAVLADEQNQ